MRSIPALTSRPGPREVEIALVAALLVVAGAGVWRLATPPARPATVEAGSSDADPGALARIDAFFRTGLPARGDADGGGLDGWRLMATRTGPDASAILQRPDGVQLPFRTGEIVGSGLTLRAVATDHVILTAGARDHRLEFTDGAPAPPPPPDVSTAALGADAARAAGEMGVSAPQQNVYASTLRPQMKDGAVEGFVWRRGGSGGALAALGLREGDVILSVGGEPLTSEERVRELDETLSSGRSIEVRYRRGAQVLTATLAPQTDR